MIGPAEYRNAAGWAPRANSLIAHATIAGAGTPPMSSAMPDAEPLALAARPAMTS